MFHGGILPHDPRARAGGVEEGAVAAASTDDRGEVPAVVLAHHSVLSKERQEKERKGGRK